MAIGMPVETHSPTNIYSPLLTLGEDGKPPTSCLVEASAAQILCQKLFEASGKRNYTDGQIAGMIDGNPPYDDSELVEAGMAWRSNGNFGIGEAFLNQALTAYWDVVFNAPTYCTVRLLDPDEAKVEEWSAVVTEEFERFNKADTEATYMFQKSQYDMVLFRHGPVVFFDPLFYKAEPISQENLFVPDGTKANVNSWPYCVIRQTYTVHDLYQFIRNPEMARSRGWNLKVTQDAIRNAMPKEFQNQTKNYDWVEYEKRLRNNDWGYSSVGDVIVVDWVLWREYPKKNEQEGKISIGAITETGNTQDWLFRKENQYDNWRQAVHPFYYDIGHGDHHSVRGMGQKAYRGLESVNRLQNQQCDFAVVAGSLHWQARDAISKEALSVIPMGPMMIHDAGLNFVQTPALGGALESVQVVKQDLIATLASNLSQYKAQLNRQKGNPPTAREIDYRADNDTIVARTAMLRYFEQLDMFWAERYRRVTDPRLTEESLGGPECREFVKRCVDRGVPEKALTKVEWVRATRTVGYGSADARRQAMQNLLMASGMFDEYGRGNILEDWTATQVGTTLTHRYVRKNQAPSRDEQEQLKEAQLQIGLAKTGLVPMMTASQNPAIFATSFVKAAMDAQASVNQGANPQDVFNFVDRIGPAAMQHIQRLKQDKSRQQQGAQLEQALSQVMANHDQLGKQIAQSVAQARQQQAQMAQQQQAMMSEDALNWRKAQADEAIKTRKIQHTMALNEAKTKQKLATNSIVTQQKMALADRTTAAKIRQQNKLATAKAAQQKQTDEQSNE